MRPIRILVTDVDELAGLGTARSLGRAGHVVVGGHARDPHEVPAVRSRYVSATRQSPDPWWFQEEYRRWLLDIVAAERVTAVFPVSEASQVAVAALRHQLDGVVLVLPDESSLRYSLSKFNATAAATASGFSVPRTAFVADGRDVGLDGIEKWAFPYLLKSDNVLLDDGVYLRGTTYKVTSAHQRDAIFDRTRAIGARMIAQEIVPGRGAGSFFLRSAGRVVASFGHERIHEVPYTGGWSAVRRSSTDSAILDQGRCLLDALDYEGLAMVEVRIDGRSPSFLEINGRPWGSIALALHAGVDFPLLALAAASEPFEADFAPVTSTDKVICSNFAGELSFLGSVAKATDLSLVRRVSRLTISTIEVIRYLVDPRVVRDIYWRSDWAPAIVEARRLMRRVRRLPQRVAKRVGRLRKRPDRTLVQRAFPSDVGSILVVCVGNVCRSPYVAARLRDALAACGSTISVQSAGLDARPGAVVPHWIRPIYDARGVDWRNHRAAPLSQAAIDAADLVIVMEESHRQDLTSRFRADHDRVRLVAEFVGESRNVADPFLASPDAALAIFDELDASLRAAETFFSEVPVGDHSPKQQGPSPAVT